MTFSIDIWKQQLAQKIQQSGDWLAHRRHREAPYLVYGALLSTTLWPAIEAAAQSGQWTAVIAALTGIGSGIGADLLGEQILKWKNQADRLNETEVADWVATYAAQNADLRDALNALLVRLETLPHLGAQLAEADRQWLAATLRQELAQLGTPGDMIAILGEGVNVAIHSSTLTGGDRAIVGSAIGGDAFSGDYNRKIQAETYIEQQTVIQPSPGDDPAALRTAYLERVLERTGSLSLAGIDPKAASAGNAETRLSLSAVYTALLTHSAEAPDRLGPERADKHLSALAMLDRHPRLVLLGDPGSGKSTFVNFVALCLVGANLHHPQANLELLTASLPDDEGQDQKERQPWQHGPLLPIPLILRDFAARGLPPVGQPATARHLFDFIAAELKAAALETYLNPLTQELLRRGGLLLLDGLDEVPEADQRRTQIKQAVEDFAATFKRCRILVTSRTYAYQQQDWRLKGFAETVLAPFSQGQIIRFVEHWYAHLATLRGLHPDDARGRAELLKRAAFGSDRLRSLAERPLLLTLMASLHAWRGGSLPEKREELYADTVELLLDWWESPKIVKDARGQAVVLQPSLAEWLNVDRDQVRRLLNQLAFQSHAAQPELTGTADVPESELVCGLLLLSVNRDVKPGRLVDYLSQRAGLLLPRGVGVYTFPHRTFQEYLAACYLTDYKYPGEVARLARTDPDRWREVTLLAGAKAARGSQSTIWSLAHKLCWAEPPQAGATPEQVWGAHLAGQALVETANLVEVDEDDRQTLARVKTWLKYILAQAALPARERALAGKTLANLGDDRPGVDLRPDGLPDILWYDVPAGPFVQGSKDNKLSFIGKETPQQTIDLPAFKISRYPITNAQYTAFVKDGGYTDKWRRCWTTAGWQWKGQKAGPDKQGGVFDLPNHPVVMVRWYEAVAFCRWLTERLQAAGELGEQEEVTLPSESQWEKAARGPHPLSLKEKGAGGEVEPRVYPWGNEADPERANYTDTGIGATNAVGCFPQGASVYGVEELSGNVWEWCRTRYEESYEKYHDDNDLEGNSPRVLRGGAFRNSDRDVRCAARGYYYPVYRYRYDGFRVCVVGVSPF